MNHVSDDSSRNELRQRNFSTGAKRKTDSAGNCARARARTDVTVLILFLRLGETAEAGNSRRKRIKRTKGMMESSLCTELADLVAGPAASGDLLLKSMCLKCFNRHGLYDVVTLRRTNSIHLSADCRLLRAREASALTLSFFRQTRRSSIFAKAVAR